MLSTNKSECIIPLGIFLGHAFLICINSFFIRLFKFFDILLILIFILLVFLFDFKSGAGGGIFYQFSNIVFKNNIFLYFIFLISLIVFYLFRLYNLNNIFLFFLLFTIKIFNFLKKGKKNKNINDEIIIILLERLNFCAKRTS